MFSLKLQQEARVVRYKKDYEQRLWVEEERQQLALKRTPVSLADRVLSYKKVIPHEIYGLFLTVI